MGELRNPLLIIILLLSMVIGSSQLTRGHEWGDDFASYIMQAESILNGDMQNFIEHNSATIYQSSAQIGPVAYPWGYPLILTPFYAIKGISPLALKLPGLLFFAGFLICFYLLMRTRLTWTESLLLVSLFAFNPMLIDFLDQILTDIPFLFFSTLALLLMINKREWNALDHAMLGGVIFLAFFIRTTGIILLLTLLAFQTIRFYWENPERKTIFINLMVAILSFGLLAFVAYSIFPSGQDSYFRQLRGFSYATFTRNISGYFALFPQFFGSSLAWLYIYYGLIPFFLLGAWTKRNRDQPLIIFFAAYFLFMIIWPEWQGPRFIFPLLPIFIYFTFQGMKFAINKLTETYHQLGQGIFYGFWFLIAGIFLFNSSMNAYVNLQNNRSINGPFDPYSMDVYNFIKEKTPADSVIVFFKPRAMRLMTNHDTIMSTECDYMSLGDYVVLSRKVGENQQIAPEEIDSCNLPLDEVLRNRRFIIYEILK
jgi:hypothetical protein